MHALWSKTQEAAYNQDLVARHSCLPVLCPCHPLLLEIQERKLGKGGNIGLLPTERSTSRFFFGTTTGAPPPIASAILRWASSMEDSYRLAIWIVTLSRASIFLSFCVKVASKSSIFFARLSTWIWTESKSLLFALPFRRKQPPMNSSIERLPCPSASRTWKRFLASAIGSCMSFIFFITSGFSRQRWNSP